MVLNISSPAFQHNGIIPDKYSCHGKNVNPPLRINNVPEGTLSLALIVDDPDAALDPDGPGHIYDHWHVVNIDPGVSEIAENSVPEGAQQLINSSGRATYTGPCPPGGEHRYYFKLFALSKKLDVPADIPKNELESLIGDCMLAQDELVGRFAAK